jgi:hypothetical protein
VGYLLLAVGATAENQTQHVFDTSVKHGRSELVWHFRLRRKPEGGDLFQVRTGPIFEFDVNERLTLIGGYYFTREQNEDRWKTINRPFGGGEIMLWGCGCGSTNPFGPNFAIPSDAEHLLVSNPRDSGVLPLAGGTLQPF